MDILTSGLISSGFKFQHLVDEAPPTVRDYVNRLKSTPQSWTWHPEGDVLVHTRIVFERAASFNDVDLMLTAFFHDLGKVDTTKPNGKGGFSASDHEDVSARLVKYNRRWILDLGGNPDKVEWLVKNHMRIKYIGEMKPNKRKALSDHQWFPSLLEFKLCDSREGVTFDMVWNAGGNPLKFLWNKFKTFLKRGI